MTTVYRFSRGVGTCSNPHLFPEVANSEDSVSEVGNGCQDAKAAHGDRLSLGFTAEELTVPRVDGNTAGRDQEDEHQPIEGHLLQHELLY